MKYIRVKWKHTNPDEPVWFFSEVNADGTELRKIECFHNGFCDIAGREASSGSAHLSIQNLPNLSELAKDPEFEVIEITKKEFEEVWVKRQFKLN